MTRQPDERMRVARDAVQLTVYVAEPHVADRRSKVDHLLREAARRGASGATVLAAFEGFGRRHTHEPTFWHRADETPLTVVFVDTAERIDALLPLVDEILPDAVAVTERVRTVRYLRPHRHQDGVGQADTERRPGAAPDGGGADPNRSST
jgi:PII-like signaling protein